MVHQARGRWPWVVATGIAALTATVLDAVLLQARRSYFTGGFLSVDHVSTLPQTLGFAAGSLLADVAVLGIVTAATFRLCQHLRIGQMAATVCALVAGVAPVAAADFIAYRLQDFLGDAFDFGLMFELAGRDPAEVLAVSSAQLTTMVTAALAGVFALGVAFLVFRRRARRTRARIPTALPLMRWVTGAVFVAALVVTTSLRVADAAVDNGLRRKPTGRALGVIVESLSDFDRDGYGLLSQYKDPDNFDAAVQPFAVELPGNGVDENGVGGDLPADDPYAEPDGAGTAWRQHPTVVVVALESFRADAMGAMVDGQAVTPILSGLAGRGVALRHAYSHNAYTVQSRQHLFSGSLAGIRRGSLIDDFNANGYETAYFSGQDESFGGPAGDVGFERASIHYDARQDVDKRYSVFSTAGSLAVSYDVVLERVQSFLEKRTAQRPLFLYVNFHDTHYPYSHREVRPLLNKTILSEGDIVPSKAAELRSMYLNTAANVDRAVGRLLSMTEAAVGGAPAVLVLSDHGESLFDEGFLGHGYALNDAQTRIPVVAAGLPFVFTEPFGQADVRDAIRQALSEPSFDSGPSSRLDPGRSVFQYLGVIERPAQISFRSANGADVYDFRTRKVRLGNGAWQDPASLAGKESERFLRLVRTWERMLVARHRYTAN